MLLDHFKFSVPATLGYILAQQYNQNNAAPEGGPFSSYIEWRVGQHLCAMIGYNSYFNSASRSPNDISGWGHITACGSVANLESMWYVLLFFPSEKMHQLIIIISGLVLLMLLRLHSVTLTIFASSQPQVLSVGTQTNHGPRRTSGIRRSYVQN